MNYLAILVASIAAFLLGWLWYMPFFGDMWKKLTKVKENKEGMGLTMLLGFITTLITAIVLSIIMQAAGMNNPVLGIIAGLLLWFGFVGPYTFSRVLYEKSPMTLWIINNGYALASLMIMGLIIGLW